MNNIGLGSVYENKLSDVSHWLKLFLDCLFCLRMKLQTPLLITSCQVFRHLMLR